MSDGQEQLEGYASREIVLFLQKHTSSCPDCGLILNGCKTIGCPGCGWKLDLEVLRSREPTVANMVSKWDFLCPNCGYNLKGSSGDGCPECGGLLSPSTLLRPEDVPLHLPRPRVVALLVGVLVCAGTSMAIGAILSSSGVSGSAALPCLAGPVLGCLAAWGVLAGARALKARAKKT